MNMKAMVELHLQELDHQQTLLPLKRVKQGSSQSLKEIPQNFKDVFNIDDVTANYAI